jgi:acetolactate synthase-1/2/3 large subunit
MKIRVSDYIAEFLVRNGIDVVFSVVGGGAMFMNDSFAKNKSIKNFYNHHEQACSIAAEAYYRVHNKIASVCVTSGPGAINALNGVVGAYQDSIPMMVFSGQTKTTLMTKNSGLDLRTLGNQEFDIMSTLSKATKYHVSLSDPKEIRYSLEKALFEAKSGRPGPSWIEVPVNIQGAYVDTDELEGFDYESSVEFNYASLEDKVSEIINRLKNAQRPIIYAGNGIRISGACDKFLDLIELSKIPVATCWDSIDLIATDNKYYVGRAGTMGDRPGNFAVQNSDVLICIGSRLNIYQVGYDVNSWARDAFVIDVDIDELELKKKTIRVDLPICCDAKCFIEFLLSKLNSDTIPRYEKWVDQCNTWKEKYPVVTIKHKEQNSPLNVYDFIDHFSRSLPDESITVVANGSASVVGSAAYYIKPKQRFIMNCGLSSMGYDLPAAIGACIANDKHEVYCIAGDGSIMMNLQELQTIITNSLPIKIVILNNDGYHQIRVTQTNIFNKHYVGLGKDSGGLSFPDFELVAKAFGYNFIRVVEKSSLQSSLKRLREQQTPTIMEVLCSKDQFFEPKLSSRKNPDGSFYSPPLEDLSPFLDRDELKRNMYIKMWDEK